MSQLGLQIIIVVAFSALCFGCGCLTAFIVTRNQWRGDMIKRGFAHYNERTGKWDWGEQASSPACLWQGPGRITSPRRFPPPWSVEELTDSTDGAINERARAPLRG
jgi:hypothetical protein